jgi:PAS domain S-box-containing protein
MSGQNESFKDLQESREWLRVTLASIGDAVITTDPHGRVTFLNAVAETLTGWTQEQAVSRSLEQIFHIVNQDTREEVENPALRALREGVIVGLANHTILIARDGSERNIDDSAAPIRNAEGKVAGAVLVFRDITERYKQEATIRQSLDYASNILSTLRHGFLVLDSDLRVISANRAFYRHFQVASEETEGKLVYELGNGQWDIPQLRQFLEEILPQNHSIEDFEVEHDFPGIGKKFMTVNARRVHKPGNHSQLILMVIEDVTERKLAQKDLRESEQRYRSVVDQVEEYAIFTADLKGYATTWNEGVKRILGFDEHEFIGVDITKAIFTPEDVASGYPELEMAIAAEKGVADNTRWMMRKSGERFYAQGVTTAQKDEHGNVIGFSKVFRDGTEKKLLEDELRDSEMRYRRLFEAAKDGVLIVDAHTRKIIDANAFMSGLTGLERDNLLGRELYEIGMFRDVEENKEAFAELQRTGYMRHEHLPIQNQRGERREVEFIANIYHEDHKLVAQCNIRDISQRVAMEKRLAAQAEQIAGESRRKDEFLAMLSHELRNPLAPIRSAVHLMRTRERGSEDAIQQQAREIIERQVANLTKIVSDLLEVSRVVSGRIRLNLQIVDVNQVVTHAVQTVTPLLEERKHELILNLCPDAVWSSADATRLEEVFINLLNNAAKYTPDGGRIEVWCEQPHGTGYAQFRVRDNGVGIDEKLLPHIFDLFTQADRSLARSAGGLGIGLSLAHRLVDLHGGSIEARSPPEGADTGSEFIVKLAVAPAPAEVVQPEASEQAAGGAGMRVLVVDDNIDLVIMLTTSLRHRGYSVQSAYTGPDGLKVAQQWRPDVVILDIGLPGLDGYEVARRLRAEQSTSDARIIALTGYGRDADVELAREAGFDAHLVKPYEFNELERLMIPV